MSDIDDKKEVREDAHEDVRGLALRAKPQVIEGKRTVKLMPDDMPRYLKPNDTPWGVAWRVLAARYHSVAGQVSRRIMQRTLKIGISARLYHPENGATGLRSKSLQYLEESIAQWVMSRDVLVFMIPTINHNGLLHPSNIRLRDYARHLDGLVLQGGADVAPHSYSQAPTRPEWSGDRARDMYELELLHEFVEAGKPVLGVCRGCQMFKSVKTPLVNSIHHQAVKELGRDLTVEAFSESDNIVEAIRYKKAPFVMGVQWHPEFHHAGGEGLLDCTPILDSFLRAARETRF